MINPSPEFMARSDADLLDEAYPTDTSIELSLEQLQQAAQMSQSVDPSLQWQHYIQALALMGIQQWLEEWAPDMEIDHSDCAIFDSPDAHSSESVCHIWIGSFHLCWLVFTRSMSATVNLPKAVFSSSSVPHLYGLVEVQEELMQVYLGGYLRCDQLLEHLSERQQLHPSEATANEIESLPLKWFNTNSTDLLVELSCLNLEMLSSAQQSLSQWAQGQAIADIYPPASVTDRQSEVNVWHWLGDRLDRTAERLRWVLMPPLTPASALRTTQDELETVGVHIPPEARGAYQILQLGNTSVRLCAITWILSLTSERESGVANIQSSNGDTGWSLLILLDAQPSTRLPAGIRLQIRDQNQLLVEQTLDREAEDARLYAQVGGYLSDRFWITIDLPDGTTHTLPPFMFNPESNLGTEEPT
jgi:hypothetical protein